MRNTYWFAVDYNGTGHLFTCPPERDTGMWTGEEALYIPKGQFGEMFPRITWQDAPVVRIRTGTALVFRMTLSASSP